MINNSKNVQFSNYLFYNRSNLSYFSRIRLRLNHLDSKAHPRIINLVNFLWEVFIRLLKYEGCNSLAHPNSKKIRIQKFKIFLIFSANRLFVFSAFIHHYTIDIPSKSTLHVEFMKRSLSLSLIRELKKRIIVGIIIHLRKLSN